MLSVDLFLLGYVWNVDLKTVARLLSGSPEVIRANVRDPIRNIGDPDLHGMGYSFSKLFSLFSLANEETFRIGITAAPIEDNFFTKYQEPNSILVTLFQTEEFCEESGRTKEEYLAHTILSQLLWAHYKARRPSAKYKDLFHKATRGCLFDSCYNKADIVIGLYACQIDPMCQGKLVEANVPESLVTGVERILNRIKTPSFLKAFQTGLQNPLFSFALGGLVFGLIINVLSSLVLGEFDSASDYYTAVLLLALAAFLVIGNYLKFLIASRRVRM